MNKHYKLKRNDQKDYKNLILIVVGLLLLVFGGPQMTDTLNITATQGSFFAGMVALAVIVLIIIFAIKVNKKEDDCDDDTTEGAPSA